MYKYIIVNDKTDKYSKDIVRFWREYLPGTPEGRLEWMNRNPDGKPIWLLALDKENDELAGTVSIMPRKMFFNGKAYLAGIVGDFMVDKKHRVFGPAMSLQKTVLESYHKYDLDFIFTIPNNASINLTKMAGFRESIKIRYFIKPVAASYYLERYIHKNLAKIISPFINIALNIFSRDTYLKKHDWDVEVEKLDDSFDELWDELKTNLNRLQHNRSASVLVWHYLENPLFKCRIIKSVEKDGKTILGYLVFLKQEESIEIIDLLYSDNSVMNSLFKYLIDLANRENVHSITCRLSDKDNIKNIIKRFGFMRSKNYINIYVHGKENGFFESWSYCEAARNI